MQYSSDQNEKFLADRVAELDVLLTFVLSCITSSESYEAFRAAVTKDIKEVKMETVMDLAKWFRDHNEGFVIRYYWEDEDTKDNEAYESHDYVRSDDGLPIMFSSLDAAQTYGVQLHEDFIDIIDISSGVVVSSFGCGTPKAIPRGEKGK